ncbi:activating transcription factor 7-interacting protein 2 isoform X3 [Notamacropus eugenii]|uniref:activating transcription factor 7-interacting protein 2 isoform X3 n=1 Tax=Notamacropus eugenii TaxID=9315 RepID=UPI003B681718
MASPDTTVQKKLKAKKTIPTSCRKQIHTLHKVGHTEPLKAVDKNVHSGNQPLSTDVMYRKSDNSDMKCFLLDSRRKTMVPQENETFPQNLVVSLKTIENNSKMNFVNEQVIDPNSRPAEKEVSCKKLFIQDSSDPQCGSEHKTNEKRFSFEQSKVDLNLKLHSSPSDSLNDLIDKSAYVLGNHVAKVFNSIGNGKENNKVGPRLEVTSQSESHVSQQSEAISVKSSNPHLDKISDLTRSIQARKHTSDFLKTQECNQTEHSTTSVCGNTVSTWHSSSDTNSSTSKKRALSGNEDNTKRMKTSDEINENMCIVEKESSLFEQRKITKLDRCIKAALKSQRTGLESKIPAQNLACKQAKNSKTVILNKSQGAEKESPSVELTSSNSKSSKPSEISVKEARPKNNLTSDCDEVVAESNSPDVLLISEENGNLKAPVTRTADGEKMVSANTSDSLGSKTKSKASKEKMKLEVIDLTEETSLNGKTETLVEVLALPVATSENLKEKNSVVQDSTQVLESFEHLPSLPEPPQQPVLTKFSDSVPPQKFELRLKRVQKPKGIALTWNTSHINPRCAPVESYHLYVCHDNSATSKSKSSWRKIGEIKALPLPMACSLSQFLSSGTYYFTIQAKDVYGRYGPFCDIKYIHGLSEDNVKDSQVLPT